jgi:tetratricopeptide (TPR) repeat protein
MSRVLLALALVAAFSSGARADKADTLFKKAKRLLAEKRYAEACQTFEDVVKLDPKAIGGLLNAGKCYEEWGRLARAYTWYEKALTTAAEAKDDREPKIKELLDELDMDVPRLTLKIPEGADLAILATLTLDGRPVDQATLGTETRVDPGLHVIEITIAGKKKKKMAPVERGGSSEITVEIPKAKAKADEPDEKPVVVVPPSDPGRGRRIAGIVLGSAGVVAIGVAGGLTLSARGKYQDAIDSHCGGSSSMCDQEGLDITHDARHRANIMTVVTLFGVAAVAGGVVLDLTAPEASAASDEHALYLAPQVSGDGAAAVLGGTF